ncbi:MAG: DUF373 family protein [Candidatus Saliniplasma sp.]
MRKLILCIDRDDDIGAKTGLNTPLIGRKEMLNAAVQLGLKDPEDSDTNSLFSAISTYDELKKEGEDVEIAAVTGSPQIGWRSDEVLAREVDQVLETVKPDTAILISDGAEDEYITPIITSKVDISHVKNVHVKQIKSVENFYYMVVKSLQEEKTKRKVLFPISLALLVYGFFTVLSLLGDIYYRGWGAVEGFSSFGVGLISFVLGLYIIGRIFELDRKALQAYFDLKRAISTAAVWLPFTIVAILLVLGSTQLGWSAILELDEPSLFIAFLTFASTVIWWWIGAILLHELGQVIDIYLKQGKIKKSFWAILFSLLALTFIFWGAFGYIRVMVGMEASNILPMVAINITLGLLIGVLGGITHTSFEKTETDDKKENKS